MSPACDVRGADDDGAVRPSMVARGGTAVVGDIARYSLHDGPGIRTTVFLKGCPLRCPWCHNPEFLRRAPEVACYPERCIGCGDCVAACPRAAIPPLTPGAVERARCRGCGECASACPAGALQLVGRPHTVDEIVEIVERDRPYFETSGGGVTLSGGEPLTWPRFAAALLHRLRQRGISTAIETSGAVPWAAFERVLDDLDLVLFDVKVADPTQHRELLGADADQVFANLTRLLARRRDGVIVRIPVVPGFTATPENLSALSQRLRPLAPPRVALLPYHPMGHRKAAAVGRALDTSLPDTPLDPTTLRRWHELFDWAQVSEG